MWRNATVVEKVLDNNKRELLSNDDGDGNENGKKAIVLGPVYMEVGDPR